METKDLIIVGAVGVGLYLWYKHNQTASAVPAVPAPAVTSTGTVLGSTTPIVATTTPVTVVTSAAVAPTPVLTLDNMMQTMPPTIAPTDTTKPVVTVMGVSNPPLV